MHSAVRLTKHCQQNASYTHRPAHGLSINKGTGTNLEGNKIKIGACATNDEEPIHIDLIVTTSQAKISMRGNSYDSLI